MTPNKISMEMMTLPIASLKRPDVQPECRTTDRALKRLHASVAANGVLSPLAVIPNGAGYYIANGNRRWVAASQCGLQRVPCVVYKVPMRELPRLWAELNDSRRVTAYEWMDAWYHDDSGGIEASMPKTILSHIKACKEIFKFEGDGIAWLLSRGVAPTVRAIVTNVHGALSAHRAKLEPVPEMGVIGKWIVTHKAQGIMVALCRMPQPMAIMRRLKRRIETDQPFTRNDFLS